MKTVLVQLWEISNPDNSIIPDGCSLHIDMKTRNNFIKSQIDEIERPVGITSEVLVSDTILEIVEKRLSVRLSEIETNNLIGLKEIVPL
jgi:hypothetical protein